MQLDEFNESAMNFIDICIDLEIPLFCNVNIRSEFLEIHRRIIFSEAILDFEKQCKKALLPHDLVNDLNAFRTRYERRLLSKPNKTPLKLSDSEIKDFKVKMILIKGLQNDLWSELCEHRVGTKISEIWQATEDSLGLNFLSLRKEDQEKHLKQKPAWSEVTDLISKYGLSSSDAMILNMFLSSKFEAFAVVVAAAGTASSFFFEQANKINPITIGKPEQKGMSPFQFSINFDELIVQDFQWVQIFEPFRTDAL